MSRTGLTDTTRETVSFLRAAPGFEPELSLDWIQTQVSINGAWGRFMKFRARCRQADTFMLGDFAFEVPVGGTKIHLGTAESIVNTLVSHVSPQHLDISVPPPSRKAQARAEIMEKYLIGAHHMIEQNTPMRREIVKHQGLYGIGWVKIEFEGSEWGDFPPPPEDEELSREYREDLERFLEERNIKWPIVAEVVNPQELIWDTESHTPRWLIRVTQIESTWVKAHFPDWPLQPGKDMVPFWECWTGTHVAYVADSVWAMPPRKHGYLVMPYVPFRPLTGLDTIGRDPADLYRGILHGNFGMLKAQSRLASQYLDIVARSAWPNNDWSGPRGMTEEAMSRYSQNPGAQNYLPPGVTRAASETVEPPQTILAAKSMIDEAIESNSVPAVARGQRPTGAASGFHTAVLAGIAALNFGAVVESTQRGLQQVNSLLLHIVEHVIQDRVTVWGRTEAGSLEASISPRDIRGHYVSIVKINAVSPEEQERKLNLWGNLWRAKFVDHVTALRLAGVANPLEVIAQLRAEEFFDDPQIRMMLNSEAARRIPLFGQLIEAAQAGATGSTAQVNDIAQNIMNTQGPQQLPNPGNFGPGNQPGLQVGGEAARTLESTRPVMPGSLQEILQTGRQIAGPRSGPVNVPGAVLAPGGGFG